MSKISVFRLFTIQLLGRFTESIKAKLLKRKTWYIKIIVKHIHEKEIRYTNNGNIVYVSTFHNTPETLLTVFKNSDNIKSVRY